MVRIDLPPVSRFREGRAGFVEAPGIALAASLFSLGEVARVLRRLRESRVESLNYRQNDVAYMLQELREKVFFQLLKKLHCNSKCKDAEHLARQNFKGFEAL